MTADELSTVDLPRLRQFFAPHSVAFVGATDRSAWSSTLFANWQRHCPDVPAYLVNPGRPLVHGQAAVASLRAIDAPVDLAFVMVGTEQVLPVLADAVDVGMRNAVVLTSGFAETDGHGAELERRLAALCADTGLAVLGPGSIGFVNAALPRPLAAIPIADLLGGSLGIVLESGGLAASVLNMAQARAVGISALIAVGNQAGLGTDDALEYLVDDDRTMAIALFAESFRRPARFRQVAARALRAGKPIVALKVGRSAAGQAVALAHTGSVAGDALVTRSVLADLGVVVVDSLEDLITTGGFLATRPRRLGTRTAVIAASGGACELIADRIDDLGFSLPDFPPQVSAALTADLPAFSSAHNPLDVTGYVVLDPMLQVRALETISAHAVGTFDQIVYQTLSPKAFHGGQEVITARYERLASAVADSPVPVVVQVASGFDLTGAPTQVSRRFGLHMLDGIEHGMTALGQALRWQRRRAELLSRPPAVAATSEPLPIPADAVGVWDEARARALLAERGVPVVAALHARTAAQAAAASLEFGDRVAVKVSVPGLSHKSDLGGVRLDTPAGSSAADAAEEVLAAARYAGLEPYGVLVSPMRAGGIELLVSVRRDPNWGPVLVVGAGGVWVDAFGDVAVTMLPTDRQRIGRLLNSLRIAPLLCGTRGRPGIDRQRLVDVISAVADAALGLGDRLDTLEINPLWAGPHECEALDSIVVWLGRPALEDNSDE